MAAKAALEKGKGKRQLSLDEAAAQIPE